jgi:hypothetical protein
VLTREPTAPRRNEHGTAPRDALRRGLEPVLAGPREVARDPRDGDVAHRHHALLVALADDPDEPAVEREVLAVQAHRLAHPQASRVQQLEERAVTDAARRRRLEQSAHLRHVERIRQAARLARQVQVRRHVHGDEALAVGEPVEALDGCSATAQAAGGQTGGPALTATCPGGEVADGRVG